MSDEKRKISALIPIALSDELTKIGYNSVTDAVLKGFELLILEEKHPTEEYQNQIKEYSKKIDFLEKKNINQIEEYQNQIKEYEKKIEEYEHQIKEEMNQINEYENRIGEYFHKIEVLQVENKIQIEYNATLKAEIEKASQREEDLKSVHNNYMLQMQTLINQKAIESPGAKKPWWRFW
jgi:chromosome segregation ATPase